MSMSENNYVHLSLFLSQKYLMTWNTAYNAIRIIILVLFSIFGSWQPLVSIHYHCKEKSSMNVLRNFSFCVKIKWK